MAHRSSGRSQNPSARNVVRRNTSGPIVVDGRVAPRERVAFQAWVCAELESFRGYVIDLSTTGARWGGVGSRLTIGARVILKVVVALGQAPLVLRAEVARYAPGPSSPQLCVRFLPSQAPGEVRRLHRTARVDDASDDAAMDATDSP